MFQNNAEAIYGLSKVFFEIAQDLSPDEILYWSRKKEQLARLLKKEHIAFMQENGRRKRIAALESAKTQEVFRKKAPFCGYLGLDDRMKLKVSYPKTETKEVFGIDLACALKPDEAIACIDAEYILSESVFTPQQVRFLAQEQFSKRISGPLRFDCTNYFPVLDINDAVIFIGVFWTEHKCHAEEPKNRWDFFLQPNLLKEDCTVLLLREVSD